MMDEVRICTDVNGFLREFVAYASGLTKESNPHEQDFQRYVLNSLTIAGQVNKLDDFLAAVAIEYGVGRNTIWRWSAGTSKPIAGMMRVILSHMAPILSGLVAEARVPKHGW